MLETLVVDDHPFESPRATLVDRELDLVATSVDELVLGNARPKVGSRQSARQNVPPVAGGRIRADDQTVQETIDRALGRRKRQWRSLMFSGYGTVYSIESFRAERQL